MPAGRWITTSLVTLAIAIGVGHVMQYGLTGQHDARAVPAPRPATTFRPIQTRADASLLFGGSADSRPAPAVDPAAPVLSITDEAIPAPASPETAPVPLPNAAAVTAPADRIDAPPGDDELGLNGFGLSCEDSLTAAVEPGARVRVTLALPCAPGRRVDLSFGGIAFALATGPEGMAEVSIPALAATTEIVARVADGPVLTERVEVPDAAAYDRVALHWTGGGRLSVHALEFDAGAGGAGHVSARRPGAPGAGGGYIVTLGDPELAEAGRVQIYSYPSAIAGRSGTVRLSVSAGVTPETCGRTLPVTTYRSEGDGTVTRSERPVRFPGCEAVGRIMVLKNVLEDLKLAGN